MDRVLCFLNPRSGGGTARQRWVPIAQQLVDCGVACETLEISREHLQSRMVAALQEQPDPPIAIVGIGGDGTHMSLMNTIREIQQAQPLLKIPPYALVPFGTGNNIAKSLNIEPGKRHWPRLVEAILHGKEYKLDLGVVNGVFFADAVSIGLDPMVLQMRDRLQQRLESYPVMNAVVHNYVVYAVALLRTLLSRAERRIEISVDSRPWYSGKMVNVIVNNTRIYGGEFDITPTGSASDGRLDVLLIPGKGQYLSTALRSFRAVRRKRNYLEPLPPDTVATPGLIQGEEIRLTFAEPVPVQVDGELSVPCAEILIHAVRGAITVKVPRDSFPPELIEMER